jgi:hypothetical protein
MFVTHCLTNARCFASVGPTSSTSGRAAVEYLAAVVLAHNVLAIRSTVKPTREQGEGTNVAADVEHNVPERISDQLVRH